ncbi:MAG: porin [Candidatus Eisenbacteria bacterium]|nr:porin [Candidatus Eisenbacteria bacterium]
MAAPLALAAILAAGAWAGPVRAADSTSTRPWYQSITLNGLVESSISHSFNRPGSRTNALRVFDTDDNTWRLDLLELVVQQSPAGPGHAGFRFDLATGSSVPRVAAAAGLFRDPKTGEAGDMDLQQAYLGYVAPVGSGLRMDLGKFITHTGAEVIDGYDGFNDNATRSFLFGYAIPFTHTGLRLSYALGPRLSAQACVMNGWDNARDNNGALTFGGQLAWTPTPALTVFLNALAGPEQAGNDSSRRSLADVVITWKMHPRVTLGLNADLGHEIAAADSGRADAQWEGLAGYARVVVAGGFSVAARGEYFRDRQGARTGTAQKVREVTLTPELRVAGGMLLRADLRHDWSDAAVFDREGGGTKSQTTLMFEAILPF